MGPTPFNDVADETLAADSGTDKHGGEFTSGQRRAHKESKQVTVERKPPDLSSSAILNSPPPPRAQQLLLNYRLPQLVPCPGGDSIRFLSFFSFIFMFPSLLLYFSNLYIRWDISTDAQIRTLFGS